MSGNTLLVETTVLDSFVGEETWVNVKVGDSHARKRAKDLNEGDLVYVNNEAIYKTIAQVEHIFTQNMAYSIAEQNLHKKNADGELINRLRIMLLEGVADPSTPDLEEKIMRENSNDFSQEEYNEFAEKIASYVTVTGSRVMDWLKGETHAPKDWDNFKRLIAINPDFDNVFRSTGELVGFYTDYKIYNETRRQVMSHLARKRSGKSSGKGQKQPTVMNPVLRDTIERTRTDLIERVVSTFVQEIDDDKSIGRVTGINKVKKKKKPGQSRNERPSPHLSKGLYTGEIEGTEINLAKIIEERHMLSIGFAGAIHRVCIDTAEKGTDMMPIARKIMENLGNYAIVNFAPSLKNEWGESVEMEISKVIHGSTGHTAAQIRRGYENCFATVQDVLNDGMMDNYLGLEPHSMARLIDLIEQYSSAMPKAYFECKEVNNRLVMERRYLSIMEGEKSSINLNEISGYLMNEIGLKAEDITVLGEGKQPRKARREQGKKIDKLASRLDKLNNYLVDEYGIIPDRKTFLIPYLLHHQDISVEGDLRATEDLLEKKRFYERQGQRFFTRSETVQLWKNMGMEKMINAYSKDNFI